MDMNIHNVKRVELSGSWPANGNSRTIRIVATTWKGEEYETEITLYGATDVLDNLPTSDDFRARSASDKMRLEAAE